MINFVHSVFCQLWFVFDLSQVSFDEEINWQKPDLSQVFCLNWFLSDL